MKLKVVIALLVLVQTLSAQKIFTYVKNSNHEAVKNYEGPLNLRDTDQATPLMWAIYSSDLKMVKLLIKKGADAKMKGWIRFTDPDSDFDFIYGSCLAVAAGEGKLDILKYLIEKQNISVEDKEINLYQNIENGWNALQWASVKGHDDLVKYLVKKGAYINAPAQTDLNQTPLILAIVFGNAETAILLTKLGANVNQRDDYGVSPIIYAFELQNRKLVKVLIQAGATYQKTDDNSLEDLLKEYFDVDRAEDL
jgi:ankyrin repeat protein